MVGQQCSYRDGSADRIFEDSSAWVSVTAVAASVRGADCNSGVGNSYETGKDRSRMVQEKGMVSR